MIDFGRHSDDYATHRPGFPPSFYERLRALVPMAGAHVLDLATGPGTVALALAARGATVVGIDIAAGQIEAAQREAAACSLGDRVAFRVGRAEETGLPAASFDVVTAGQSWHWFDGPRVLAEAQRVLRPGGALAIAHYSYLAEHDAVAAESEALVMKHNPSWPWAGSTGLFPSQIDAVMRSGFDLVEQFCYNHAEPFSHAAWRGRMRTCNGVGSGGLSPEGVARFDADLQRLLQERHPDPMLIQHRVWCVVARTRGQG